MQGTRFTPESNLGSSLLLPFRHSKHTQPLMRPTSNVECLSFEQVEAYVPCLHKKQPHLGGIRGQRGSHLRCSPLWTTLLRDEDCNDTTVDD